MAPPWKILHIDLSQGIPQLPALAEYEKTYVVFWWNNIPLGHLEIDLADLPLSATQLANLATVAITPAMGNRLFPYGFNEPLSEHFIKEITHPSQTLQPDYYSLLTFKKPLEQLEEKYRLNPCLETSAVSIIICTRDRPEQLKRVLDSLDKLSFPSTEIIVVDNAPSTDATRQIVADVPKVHYVLEPRPGLSVARNTGIRHSTGDIIAFTDDDVAVHPDWIFRIQQAFQNSQVMAVTGLVLPAELETESQLVFEVGLGNFGWGYQQKSFDRDFFELTKPWGVPVWRIGAGANMAFRRQIFERVAYFDERLGAGASGCSEDSEMWYRILAEGGSCLYEPTIVVFHYHRRELDSLREQMYQYMRGHVVALLIQFARYKHWGNLYRLFFALPKHYTGMILGGLLKGFKLKHRTVLAEISGCLAGVNFYLKNRGNKANF